MKYQLPIFFALLTALCWGLYGPTVANARDAQRPPRWSPFKPYVFIGIAYLVLACGGGVIGMQAKGDTYNFTGDEKAAATWGFAAGALGAFGSLAVTAAMLSFPPGTRPRPELVMPIVFGGAVAVSAVTAAIQARFAGVNPLMWVGIGVVILGVFLTAYYTPHGGPAHGPAGQPGHATAPAGEPVAGTTGTGKT